MVGQCDGLNKMVSIDSDGMASLEDSGERIGINFEDEEQVTIGGYVFNLLGRVPVAGDKAEDESCIYEVLDVDGNRVKKIRAVLKQKDTNNSESFE